MSECRSCGAPIRWAITPKARRIPLDPRPNAAGNIELTSEIRKGLPVVRVIKKLELYAGPRYISHFATCPNAKRHRRREHRQETLA